MKLNTLLELKWWNLTMDIKPFKRWGKQGYQALAITGMSSYEKQLIKEWCRANDVVKRQKFQKFNETLSGKWLEERFPNYTGGDASWTETETGVIDKPEKIDKLKAYLESISRRKIELAVQGLSKSDVKKICKKAEYRYVELANGWAFVSVTDKQLAAELALKGSA